MQPFLSILLYTAIFKFNHEDIRSRFATDGTGRNIWSCFFWKTFLVLLAAIWFHNPDNRRQRKLTHLDSAIYDFFQLFVKNIQTNYVIGAIACVDEIWIGVTGRFLFKMYIHIFPSRIWNKTSKFDWCSNLLFI